MHKLSAAIVAASILCPPFANAALVDFTVSTTFTSVYLDRLPLTGTLTVDMGTGLFSMPA